MGKRALRSLWQPDKPQDREDACDDKGARKAQLQHWLHESNYRRVTRLCFADGVYKPLPQGDTEVHGANLAVQRLDALSF